MYQNYIFDLYGTLVDIHTNEKKRYLWDKVALVYGLQGADYTGKELRKRFLELESRCPKNQEVQLRQVFQDLYLEKGVEPTENQIMDMGLFFRAISLEHLSLYEGAFSLLERLHQSGKKVFLLSNAQRMFTEPEMRKLQIYDKFDGICYSSDIGYKKPSPYFYQELFQRYALRKEESVMIGNDSKADILGAHEFGIDSMYIHTKQSPELTVTLPDTCKVLKTIQEVYSVIE